MVTRGDELFWNKSNVERAIEIGEKALSNIFEPFVMARADGHPVRQIVYDVRHLETSQPLAMSWGRGVVERSDALLVFSLIRHVFSLPVFLSATPFHEHRGH